MVDKMSVTTNIISEIDSIQTALSTLRSNVLDFLKSEKPSVPKKRGRKPKTTTSSTSQLAIHTSSTTLSLSFCSTIPSLSNTSPSTFPPATTFFSTSSSSTTSSTSSSPITTSSSSTSASTTSSTSSTSKTSSTSSLLLLQPLYLLVQLLIFLESFTPTNSTTSILTTNSSQPTYSTIVKSKNMHTLSQPSTNKISHSLLPIQHKIPSIKKTPPIIKYSTKVISTTDETPSELCRRLVSSINFLQQTFKSFSKHVREPTDAVVWKADSADSLKNAKLFLSSLPNIRFHDPVLLNPTITVLGLLTWVTNEELETSFNLLFPSVDLSAFRAFRHRPNARNPSTSDWLTQVPSNVLPMLNKSKNIHLPFGRFPFYYRIHPTRCLNCQTYGHNISKCQNPRVCEYCAKDHSSDNCPKTSPSFCVSCFKSKRSCHDHVTTSSSCPLIRQQVFQDGTYGLGMTVSLSS